MLNKNENVLNRICLKSKSVLQGDQQENESDYYEDRNVLTERRHVEDLGSSADFASQNWRHKDKVS